MALLSASHPQPAGCPGSGNHPLFCFTEGSQSQSGCHVAEGWKIQEPGVEGHWDRSALGHTPRFLFALPSFTVPALSPALSPSSFVHFPFFTVPGLGTPVWACWRGTMAEHTYQLWLVLSSRDWGSTRKRWPRGLLAAQQPETKAQSRTFSWTLPAPHPSLRVWERQCSHHHYDAYTQPHTLPEFQPLCGRAWGTDMTAGKQTRKPGGQPGGNAVSRPGRPGLAMILPNL